MSKTFRGWLARGRWNGWGEKLGRALVTVVLVLGVFSVLLWALGKDPVRGYMDTMRYALGSFRGFSEVLVRTIPLILTALAVALPSRAGLINVGGEGQLFMGAWLATWGALTFPSLPQPILIPLLLVLGFVGGALWAAIPAFLRAKGWANETIATVLLNYVAPMVVGYFVFGAWRAPEMAFFPQSYEFAPAAQLPRLVSGTRIHLGLVFALLAAVLYWIVVTKTRWGLEIRAVGGNAQAARRLGLSPAKYILLAMLIGGGLAGIAGMGEVSAIHGRLKMGLSPGFGYMGFLINWVTGGNVIGILFMAFVLGVISSGGFVLQTTQGLPFAAVNVLMALILFVVLARPAEAWGGKR